MFSYLKRFYQFNKGKPKDHATYKICLKTQASNGTFSVKRLKMKNEHQTHVTFTIAEMAKKFEVTPRTLRFYESKELLFPIRIAQRRLFTKRDQARLKLILQGKRFGFSLEEIRQLLNLYDIGDQQTTQLAKTYELAEQRLVIMEAQRDELSSAIMDLQAMLSEGGKELLKRGITV